MDSDITVLRRAFKRSMMRSAKADRILTLLYPLRKAYSLSYLLALFIFSLVSLSSYLFQGFVAGEIVSSYRQFWLRSLFYAMMLFGVLHENDDHDESSNIKDHVEDVGSYGPRVAAYLRVSTGRQAKEGFSLPAQREQLNKLKDQLKPSKICWFVDAGKSGVAFDGRKITSIMQHAEKREIDELWVTQIDRIGRECIELVLFFLNLCKKGVLIRTPEKVYSLKDLSSVLTYVIEARGAEEENKRRARSAMASKTQRFRGKKWNKTCIPLAYKKKEDWLEKNPTWEPIVKEIHEHFLRMGNFESVRIYINRKYLHVLHAPLTRYQIRSILSDPIYAGRPEHLGEVVNDPSLAYVDEQKFINAQEVINRIRSKHRPNRVDPLKDLIDTCGISALEFLDQLEYHHKQCGGLVVKNGTKLAGSLTRQIMRCRKCQIQWAVPSNTQLKRMNEFPSWKDNGGESRIPPSNNEQKTKRNGWIEVKKDRNLYEFLR